MNNESVLAPQNLSQLHDLIVALNNKTAPIRLGKRSLDALIALSKVPEPAAFESINQLGQRLAISPSSLSRMAMRIGFNGFNDLQQVFRESLTETNHFYSDKAHRLDQVNQGQELSSCQEILLKVANEEINNIHKMIGNIAPEQINDTIALLHQARGIRTFAQRQFYSLAAYFSYCLGLLRDQVSVLGESGHGAPHALAQMNKQDLLIVFGCHPYSRITVESCRQAEVLEIPTLVFSDSPSAPLNKSAKGTFILPTEGSFYSNSSAAWVVLMEAILTAYAQSLGGDAITKLEQRERMFKQMQVTYTP